ncbi:hypothetical protein COV42_03100 [Candidatus Campbellbacteria bacterium CG11_big_fil_rev_8_21_14_0_20_44_21]|uniref:Uncharacterized protein n=1 Tax=Candidatus Campbellbacteria bacterium CG22_combo_CG10-13_8_21_14_all_43_18 TaxID=1974530 RepID=A0A2H0DWB9_9BACT|nr:MAG: hypothetical protein COW82_01945 [Candidatus Campbellbacteria bacterium CG22_combo_CG10-13_8_21_14_all_43_18]PIR24037.1 MAG: hypothetical protein COV42_03100 [Candidatus Campbellbacteria bacterium CG11_big_fil_rev_8_21_14_0_20_44_21]
MKFTDSKRGLKREKPHKVGSFSRHSRNEHRYIGTHSGILAKKEKKVNHLSIPTVKSSKRSRPFQRKKEPKKD